MPRHEKWRLEPPILTSLAPFLELLRSPQCMFVFTTAEFSVELSHQRQLLADGVEVYSLEIAFEADGEH